MNCPFWSVREGIHGTKGVHGFHPCTNACALYMNGSCAFVVIASELAKKNSKNQERTS